MLDWEALREALQTALLEAVSAEAGGPWHAAALDQVYDETDDIMRELVSKQALVGTCAA
jgi:hypothetical protein